MSGTPLVLFDEQYRTAILSPQNNFIAGIHARISTNSNTSSAIACGIKATVSSLPSGFRAAVHWHANNEGKVEGAFAKVTFSIGLQSQILS